MDEVQTEIMGGHWGGMRGVDTSTMRQNFRTVIEGASRLGRRLIITRNGRPEAALVPLRDLDLIRRWEAEAAQRGAEALSGRPPTLPSETFSLEEVFERRAGAAAAVSAPEEVPPRIHPITKEQMKEMFSQVKFDTIRNFHIARIARKTSNLVIEQINEHLGEEQTLPADKQEEIQANVLESVMSAVVETEQDEKFIEMI